MRKYFVENRSTVMSKAVFSVRSGTFDIKVWNESIYDNLNCVTYAKKVFNVYVLPVIWKLLYRFKLKRNIGILFRETKSNCH